MLKLISFKGTELAKPQELNHSVVGQANIQANSELQADTLDLSTKKEEKKTPWGMIVGGIVAAAGVVFAIVKLKGNSSKAAEGLDDLSKKAEQKAEDVIDNAKQKVERKINDIKGNKADEELVSPTSSNKPNKEPKQNNVIDEKLQKTINDFQGNINKNGIYGKVDEEVITIISNSEKYKGKEISGFSLHLDLISNRTLIFDELLLAAKAAKKLEDKERLLMKSFEFLPHGEKAESYYKKYTEPVKIEELYKELKGLYSGEGNFKFKKEFASKIEPKFIRAFQDGTEHQNLKKIMGSNCDYDLYETLVAKSKTYKDVWRKDTNPMGNLTWQKMSDSDERDVVTFLNDVMPDLISGTKDVAKKEDMLRKLLNVTRSYTNSNHTERSFEILDRLSSIHTDEATKNGRFFKERYAIKEDLEKTLDEFIFSKFKLPSFTTQEEKMELAREIINRKNVRFFFLKPEEVQYKNVLNGIKTIAKKQNSEKHYQAAIDFAQQQNARTEAMAIIEEIEKNLNLSKSFKDNMTALKTEFKQQIAKMAKEVENSLSSKTLNEAFDYLTSQTSVQNAIKEVAKKQGKSPAEIQKLMQDGDGKTIRKILDKSISMGDFENKSYKGEDCAFWDDMISYLGKIDAVVKDPKELEFLKNYRARALGAKVMGFKNTNPEKAGLYHEILKSDIKDVLFGKGGKAGLAKEAIDDNSINAIARQIEDYVWVFENEATIYSSLERNFEKGSFNDDAAKVLKSKMQEMKDRLGFRSEEDYYNDFNSRFKGTGSRTTRMPKDSAVDSFNKYLAGNEKITVNSSADEIKAAYRKLSHKFHPDTCEGDKVAGEAIFKELSEAYATINPKKK